VVNALGPELLLAEGPAPADDVDEAAPVAALVAALVAAAPAAVELELEPPPPQPPKSRAAAIIRGIRTLRTRIGLLAARHHWRLPRRTPR
jgi:hypothetical protein